MAPPRLRRVSLLAALVAWGFLLWQGARLFSPDSSLLSLYTSDEATPLLMTHDSCTTPFCLFYFGQDRFGAWPFLLGHLAGRMVHFTWSAERLSAWRILFIFSAAWPLRALALKSDWIVPTYQGTLLLDRLLQLHVLNEGPYGWQVSTLIWSWWFLRRVTLSTHRWRWFAAACLGGGLATWISSTSAVYLALLAGVEFGYAQLRAVSERVRWAHLPMLLLPSAVGLTFEATLRGWYHRYTTANSYPTYVTPVRLDRGHLLENFAALWKQLRDWPWWPLQIVAVLAGIFFLAHWTVRLRRRAGPVFEERQDHWRALAIASGLVCLATFLIPGLVLHVRNNNYHPRYFSLTHLFAALGTVASIAAILSRRRPLLGAYPISSAGRTVAITLVVTVALPSRGTNPTYGDLKATANWLGEQHAPVLLGGYWGTYVFSALALPKRVVPVPIEGEDQRTPWTAAAIHEVPQLYLTAYRSDRLGPADHPDPWVTDKGEFLLRGQTAAFTRGAITLWFYRNQSKRSLRVYPSMPPTRWNGCGLQELSLTFQPIAHAELVYWFEDPGRPSLEAWGQTQSGLSIRLEEPERGALMVRHRFDFAESIHTIALRPAPSSERCFLRSVALFEP